MKKFKKILSVVIASLLLISALPFASASALGEYEVNIFEPYEMTVGEKGETVKFTPAEDGWYRFYTLGNCDTYATLYNALHSEIDYADDTPSSINFSLNCKLYKGYTYYLSVGAYGTDFVDKSFTLCVEESIGVEGIYISKEPDNPTVVEDYEYQTSFCEGMEVEFTMSDESVATWAYGDDQEINGIPINVEFDFSLLGKFYVEISCGDASAKYYFTTIENPIDHIDYEGPGITLYEDFGGFFDEDLNYYYYNYEIPKEGIITVYYKDGTTESGDMDTSFRVGLSEYYDNQDSTPWTTDSASIVTLSLIGNETNVPVSVLPCPIEKITINSAPTKQYIIGDPLYGSTMEGTYILVPRDITGISFTVEYKDGSKETYTDKDFDTDNSTIDGDMYYIDYLEVSATGKHTATLHYKGGEINYDIEVIDSPVKKIEILSDPVRTDYHGLFYPIFDGMKIKVTYNDNTTETITLSSENTTYQYDGYFSYKIELDNAYIIIEYNNNEETGEFYTLDCFGETVDYTGFNFNYDYDITAEFENLTADIDGALMHLTFNDGTKKTCTMKKLATFNYDEDFTEGVLLTEEGIAYFDIEKLYEGKEHTGYSFYCLGNYVEIPLAEPSPEGLLGDANQDGEINIKDATAIQKHIAQLELLPDSALTLADADKDEDVNIKDATAIQKHIAGINTGYPIGEAL